MPSVKVKRTKHNGGFAALFVRSGKLDRVGVWVGHDKSSGRYPDGGPTVADVGRWNSKGTDKIPARDYLKHMVKTYKDKYRKVMAALSKNYLLGRLKKDKADRNMGIRGVKELKAAISAWSTPRNAASTIKKKGFNNPLIHTKKLLKSTMWKGVK